MYLQTHVVDFLPDLFKHCDTARIDTTHRCNVQNEMRISLQQCYREIWWMIITT